MMKNVSFKGFFGRKGKDRHSSPRRNSGVKPFTWPIDWLMQYIMMTEDHACYRRIHQ